MACDEVGDLVAMVISSRNSSNGLGVWGLFEGEMTLMLHWNVSRVHDRHGCGGEV